MHNNKAGCQEKDAPQNDRPKSGDGTHLLLLRRCITGLVSWQVLAGEQVLCEVMMSIVPFGTITLQTQGGVRLACPYTGWQMDGRVLDDAGVERACFLSGGSAQLAQDAIAGVREYQVLDGGPMLRPEGFEPDGIRVWANDMPAAHMRCEASGAYLGQAGRYNIDKALTLELDSRFVNLLPHIVLCLVL